MIRRYDAVAEYIGTGEYVGGVVEDIEGDFVRVGDLAELVMRMRNWLAESAVSERITARRCAEFRAILDEFSGGGRAEK
jgi:hypothetical protein